MQAALPLRTVNVARLALLAVLITAAIFVVAYLAVVAPRLASPAFDAPRAIDQAVVNHIASEQADRIVVPAAPVTPADDGDALAPWMHRPQ